MRLGSLLLSLCLLASMPALAQPAPRPTPAQLRELERQARVADGVQRRAGADLDGLGQGVEHVSELVDPVALLVEERGWTPEQLTGWLEDLLTTLVG